MLTEILIISVIIGAIIGAVIYVLRGHDHHDGGGGSSKGSDPEVR